MDPKEYLNFNSKTVINYLEDRTKMKLILITVMMKTDLKTGETIEKEAQFHSTVETVLSSSSAEDAYKRMTQKSLQNMANFQRQGSNWRFKSIVALEIFKARYVPLRGSSYIPLPKTLTLKKAIINLKNKDNECFKWAVLRALHPTEKNAHRITNALKENQYSYNWGNIKFPTTVKDIDIFEKLNPSISINVFGYEQSVFPLRISKRKQSYNNYINLLLLSDEKNNTHYCVIKSMSRLLSSQLSKHEKNVYICYYCLNHFGSEKVLNEHANLCKENEPVRVILPKKGTKLSFKNQNRLMKIPFVIYADFEAFTQPIDSCSPNSSASYTNKYQKHTPSGFSYYIKCFDDNIFSHKPIIYIKSSENENIGQIFVDSIEKSVRDFYKPPKKMIFSKVDSKNFDNSINCWICKEELGEDRVRDHCHFTGKFRGAAHNECNMQFRRPKFVPIIFHNLSGYDNHLFIKNLGVSEGKISCIPNTDEKYISFTKQIIVDEFTDKDDKLVQVKQDLRFIDSFKFMNSSLNSLVNNLNKKQFKNTEKYSDTTGIDLLTRKGVYPYDYMNSLEKFSDEKLPPKESFYSRLNDEGITDEDYEHAQTVWNKFNLKTMKDYHNLYLKTDVLLLADVFESFRDVCMKNYDLDPAWYYTAPGLAWDAALKLTTVKLELLSDPEMLLMFESGIRGGISTITNRYGKANNKYMGDNYNKKSESKYLQYLDANNLYGWAMSNPLPTHDFKWMGNDEIKLWEKYQCILEVDLEYPTDLHKKHNDYPLALESLKINEIVKLIPNLKNKDKYVIYYKNLKLYRDLGLKITKIHRGIKFKERNWLKQYIDLNTDLRTKANNDFEKDFFKLMNNSVFGKTMENIRNRVSVELVSTEKKAEKLVSKTRFEHLNIFDENLIAIHMKKTTLNYNKPVYLGMCILDLSKYLMYDFHYNYIKKKYDSNAKLMFTDTDSLLYEIQTADFYEDIKPDINTLFDTSNFSDDHASGIETGINKKVVGKFKDEAGGKIIEEFVGLRAKLYSYKMFENKVEYRKCKGIKRGVVKNSITHDDYLNCLFEGKDTLRKMNVIRSYQHELYSEEVNKIALSSDDDKRIIRNNGIDTYAYGHYRTTAILDPSD